MIECATADTSQRLTPPGGVSKQTKIQFESHTRASDFSARHDFTLRPAALAAEQTVVSDAGAPALDTTRTVAGGSVTREELERLPLFTRSPLDFVFLLGGVTEEPLPTLYF